MSTEEPHPTYSQDSPGVQRRVRHISKIQIRNLTPFPVRDTVTSALSQPSEQSQHTSGQLTDDLAILARKRSRKVSTTSTATRRSLKWEDATGEEGDLARSMGEVRDRKTSASKPTISSLTAARGEKPSTHSTQLSHPMRLHSTPSYTGLPEPYVSFASPGGYTTSLKPDSSQRGLEKVISSRLVETFITIMVNPPREGSEKQHPWAEPSAHLDSVHSTVVISAKPSLPSATAKSPTPKRNKGGPIPPKRPLPQSKPDSIKARNTSMPLSPSTSTRLSSSQNKLSGGISPRYHTRSANVEQSSVPDYISIIHRPSTNPSFIIDKQPNHEYADWTDTRGHDLRIEVWGRMPKIWYEGRTSEEKSAKGKEKGYKYADEDFEWRVLDQWNLNLDDLILLPDEFAAHPSQLPSNSLLISLSPPGETLYYPPRHSLLSRPSTPSAGYTSDPESELRKAKQARKYSSSSNLDEDESFDVIAHSRRRHHNHVSGANDRKALTKSATWDQLFQLAARQAHILDTANSISHLQHEITDVLHDDNLIAMQREISEREAYVRQLQLDISEVSKKSKEARAELSVRVEQIQRRGELLAAAKILDQETIADGRQTADCISEERRHLQSLATRFHPTRTSLLTTLSTIFPIELYSPPDLLYTILDVPLPIPLSSTDPAPPLSLTSHKSVTEESVATALGYVAQVLQFLAAYLGKNLVYPITCIGSRSLIKDGISAMVGPRMFPLFSKGVDTYRFEYGVFLLNKDIEMLMAERDLRALDMRHTLPNLKNLLLTLSHGDDINARRPLSAPTNLTLHPIKQMVELKEGAMSSFESTTPPVSGSTTPTVGTADESKKARPFLGLAPFTDFIRSRYPSSSRTAEADSSVNNTCENVLTEEDVSESHGSAEEEEEEEEEDQRTIRSVPFGTDGDGYDGQDNVEKDATSSVESSITERKINGDFGSSPESQGISTANTT
ncbi:hypothetical protein BDQ12DRAFT_720651 [Crucibulum laeve]|uniref:Autophagy-related protein 14 n=1 Tax=Crucibulum laeve TaxID=68775 RepID=A0A5C3M898_9AGAR|nr:hypothetical protein BDQ12DRAFT_720651 [Crucibulum laeve]